MNKKYLLIVLFLSSSVLSFAQDEERKAKRYDQLKAKRVAYITDKVSLTSKQAEKFWPIYNEHEKMRNEKFGDPKKGRKNIDELSDNEASTLLEEQMRKEDEMVVERKKYISNLRNVISDKQILALRDAEKKFRREVFNKFKNRKYRKMGQKGEMRGQRKSK